MPALPAFLERYPELQLHLGVSDRRVDLLGEGVDCVVRGGELTDSSLVVRRVAELPMLVCAAPDYLRREGTPSHPLVLAEAAHRLVGFLSSRTGRTVPTVLQRDGERLELTARHAVAVDDGNAYLAAGLAGLGVVCLPRYMARPHLERGELVPLFDDWRLAPLPMVVAYPSRRVSARLRVFIDWVAEVMAAAGRVGDRRRRAG